ncbi:hypothetical protein AXG93_1154s2120 [Marchantia polymorpha subsp. ruderalis]|uniref:Uncharacterized protein n=1 Tax=Marchantia polymorpha subsp. ruderalis TaxID=1480154 RepID=A0A176WTX4_MARPO|nr:hypothetical protein AXG93_1154s2120 [Marchantia polymorpha subsp. ruderalis]
MMGAASAQIPSLSRSRVQNRPADLPVSRGENAESVGFPASFPATGDAGAPPADVAKDDVGSRSAGAGVGPGGVGVKHTTRLPSIPTNSPGAHDFLYSRLDPEGEFWIIGATQKLGSCFTPSLIVVDPRTEASIRFAFARPVNNSLHRITFAYVDPRTEASLVLCRGAIMVSEASEGIHSQQVMGIWGQQVSEATSEKLDRFAGPVQQCESAIMSISLQNAPASRASVVRKTPRRPSFFFSRHAHAKQRTGPNSEWDDGARVLVRFTFRAGQSESLRSASSASSSRWPAATIHCERELNGRRERSCGSEAPLFTVFNSAKGAGAGGGGGGGPRTDSGPGLTTH